MLEFMNIESQAKNPGTPTRLVWIDLEMTGLDTSIHKIIEAAVIITDFEFTELASYEAVIHQPESVISLSSEFSMEQHTKSGLYASVKSSTISDKEADSAVSELIKKFVPEGQVYLAGNSIRADRAFIDTYWPKVSGLLHYRMLDVSSFKLWWLGNGKEPFVKGESHRAQDDIRESIAELKYYHPTSL
jgi:oligoribonuclease